VKFFNKEEKMFYLNLIVQLQCCQVSNRQGGQVLMAMICKSCTYTYIMQQLWQQPLNTVEKTRGCSARQTDIHILPIKPHNISYFKKL